MNAILQTMTLAVILLIIGLVCLLIGVLALMWSAGRDRRREERGGQAEIPGEPAADVLPQSARW